MTLVMNKPPTGGDCTVTPPVGRVMVDTFLVECHGWEDPEEAGVDLYSFFSKFFDPSGAVLIHFLIFVCICFFLFLFLVPASMMEF